MNRIAELNAINDTIIWIKAIKERGELQDSLRSQNTNVHVNVNK